MIEATTWPRICQVRSQTDLPCGRPAATTVLGVFLCERCACEQKAISPWASSHRSPGDESQGELSQQPAPSGSVPRGSPGYHDVFGKGLPGARGLRFWRP